MDATRVGITYNEGHNVIDGWNIDRNCL